VKKKLLSCALAVVMLFGSFMLPASIPLADLFGIEVAAVTSGDYTYSVNSDGTITITKYIGDGGDVKIPGTIDWKTVTVIGDWAFTQYDITSITIPDSVTKIDAYAFNDCYNLKSVKIGNSVKSIGNSAFIDCEELAAITIPNSVTKIEDCAFWGCSKLKSAKIGNNVKSIGDWTFWGCENLTAITIPNSVTKLGYGAFKECLKIKSAKIGSSVKNIEGYTFGSCKELNQITIPNSVTKIGEFAFSGCTKLKSVKIGKSVKSIGSSAFNWCENLTSIKIPNSVTTIGASAFLSCKKLKSITIPNSVTEIDATSGELGGATFQDCTSLKTVTIGDGVRFISFKTFYGCINLTSVKIGKSVTGMGYDAFRGCTSLRAITIPDNVTLIGQESFRDCKSLKRMVIGKGVDFIYDEDTIFAGITPPIIYTNNSYVKKEFKDVKGVTCKPLSKWNVKPSGIKLNKVTSKTASISWKRVPEASGYQISKYNPSTGKYKVVSTKKPDVLKYDITKNLKPATVYKYRVKSFVQVNGKKYYSSPTNITIRTRNAPVKISSVTSPKTKTVKVAWKKDSKGNGYEVQIAKNKEFTSGKKSYIIKKNGTTAKTISGLTKGQTYYVRVRAYQTVSGKRYYGDWSVKKSVTCK